MDKLTSRELEAYNLRQQGLKFKEIGHLMCIGMGRASGLCRIAKRKLSQEPHWTDGLSIRAANCLFYCKIESRTQALLAIRKGLLAPNKFRNYGWKTHREVCRWLGLPEPQRKKKVCPHCGGDLSNAETH